jgi:HK97 family phage major capsid protein
MNPRIAELRERINTLHAELNEVLNGIAERDGIMTAEERESVERRTTDLRSMGETLNALEDAERREAELAASTGGPPELPGGGENRYTSNASSNTDGNAGDGPKEFRDVGEFIRAVRMSERGRMDPRLPEAREFSMDVGSELGILVPEQFREELLAVDPEAEIVRPRAVVIPAGSPPDAPITFPALKQGDLGALGGMSFAWLAEGGAKPETDFEVEEIKLEPREVAGTTVVTDKLLRNSAAASVIINRMMNMGISQERDRQYLKGDGVGKPLGIFNSPCSLTVTRAGAGAVAFADIVNMISKLLPESWGSAEWLSHVTTLPQIVALADAVGNSIFIGGDATRRIPANLFGLPIRWTGKTYPLGTQGDLGLMDYRYYLIKDGSGPFVASSGHVYFTTNKTVLKIFLLTDGQAWMLNPLTLDDGVSQVSPFVLLK